MSALDLVTGNGTEPTESVSVDALYQRAMNLAPDLQVALRQVNDGLDDLDAQLRAEIATARNRHQRAVGELQAKKRKLMALARALDVPMETPTPKAKPRGNGTGVSSHILLRFVSRILEYSDEETFTALGLHIAVKATWSEPHTYQAVAFLRNHKGFIGRVGLENGPNSRALFQVMNRDAGRQLLRELNEAPSRSRSPDRTSDGPAIGKGVSVRRALQVAEVVRRLIEETNEEVTTKQIANALGLASSSETGARDVLIALGRVGYLEERKGINSASDRPSNLYRIANPRALDHLRESN